MGTIFLTPTPTIEVLIHRANGDIDIEQCFTEREARAFCREEVKWESTARVICEAINFDERGDFSAIDTK